MFVLELHRRIRLELLLSAMCPGTVFPCDMLAGQVSSAYKEYGWSTSGGGRAHYVMVCVSKMQWKPFWLATQLDPQNDWTGWQTGVNDDVCAQVNS